jgi:hypothetical protein
MILEIQEERQGQGRGLQEQHHYNDYLNLRSSAYSLFVIAIRSPHTKQKYLQRFGYFLDFAQIATEKGTSIEERCNNLSELAKGDYKWLLNRIFNYLQLLKSRVESKEIKPSTLRNNIKPIKERKYANDRAPKLKEIIRISDYPDRRIKNYAFSFLNLPLLCQWYFVCPLQVDRLVPTV